MTDTARLNATLTTLLHIGRVAELLNKFSRDLMERGASHDYSKFAPVEMDALTEMQRLIDAEGQAPYGSPEYDRRTALLAPMLAHHYANNSHHPQHYESGVSGMTLIDLVEMLADWKAASERGEESSIGLSHSVHRFQIDPQLAQILRNTCTAYGWSVD